MWCDNCCLLFPLRAGAIVVAVFMMLYQIAGGILLFSYGDFFFFHYPESQVYGGYAMAQAGMAILVVIAFSNRLYVWTKVCLRIYPIIVLLGAVRAGIMAWSLPHYKDRIIAECQNGGIKWADQQKARENPGQYDPTADSNRTLPMGFCNAGVDNFIAVFTTFLVIDFVLMLYMTFLIWRFHVKLRHYPVEIGKYSAYD